MTASGDLARLRDVASRHPWVRGVVVLDATSSTNDALRRLAAEGAPEGTAVVADAQTAGRGRRGRAWHSPPGLGLHLSVLFRPRRPPHEIPRWTIGAAVAACAACRACGADAVTIKWPNDLVAGSRKVGGILAELRSVSADRHELVVGIGLNVLHRPSDFPEDLGRRACSLLDLVPDPPPDRAALAELVLAGLATVASSLADGRWDDVASRWLAFAPEATGRRVRLARPDGTWAAGHTRGIDALGALRVAIEDGSVVLATHGDVIEREEG